MSFDPVTGRLFVADVGQNANEELNIVTSGFNAGWSWREGKHQHTPAVAPTDPPPGWISGDPIYEYDHTNDGAGSGNDSVIYGTSITGGVNRGDRLPELFGKHLFCDCNTGFIVALTENGPGNGPEPALPRTPGFPAGATTRAPGCAVVRPDRRAGETTGAQRRLRHPSTRTAFKDRCFPGHRHPHTEPRDLRLRAERAILERPRDKIPMVCDKKPD